MSEKSDNYQAQLFLLLVISIALVLASSVGVFNGVLSIGEKAQSYYRIRIDRSFHGFSDTIKAFSDIANVKKERDQYRKDNADLKAKVSDLKVQLSEAKLIGLQSQTSFADRYKLVPTEVIRYKPEEPGLMVINKGTVDGVKNGDIIINSNYAIGEVTNASKYTAEVRTIKASDSEVLVVSERGVKGVLRARGGRELIVEEVLSNADVQIGDDFFTAGVNSNFVPDLFVGEAFQIDKSASSTTKAIKLKNNQDFSDLRKIFVLCHEN